MSSWPHLSIGAKLTLRYTAAMLVTLSIFVAYAYDRVERRINRQARLVLSQEINAILAEEREARAPGALVGFIGRRIATADSELDLSVEWFDPDGTRRRAWGTLADHEVRPPAALLLGEDDWHQSEKQLGPGHAYFVMASAARDGFVQVAISSQRFAESAGHIREVFLLAMPVMLLLTGVAGFALARGSLRPISQLTRGARRIHGANLDERLPTTGSGDELDELAETLNGMIARIRSSMAGLRRFTGDAAHQLRTPLAALRSQLEVTLEKERSAEEYRKVLSGLGDQVEHLVDGVNAMLRLAESQGGLDPSRRVPVELGPLLEELVAFFTPVAEEQGIALRSSGDPSLRVAGDAAWLHQLFANLLHNAVQHTPRGGQIGVQLRTRAGWAVVRISDTGVGIAPDQVDRVFERFQRASAAADRPGAGLGLTIAREIAVAHEGRIEVESAPGQGTTFAVWLPRCPEGAPR